MPYDDIAHKYDIEDGDWHDAQEILWTSGPGREIATVKRKDCDGYGWIEHRTQRNKWRSSICLYQSQMSRPCEGGVYHVRLTEYLGGGCRAMSTRVYKANARQICGLNKIAVMAANAFPGKIEETISYFRIAAVALLTDGETLKGEL